jgi:hypothetical protein
MPGARCDLLPAGAGTDNSDVQEPTPTPPAESQVEGAAPFVENGARLAAECGRQYVVSNLRRVALAVKGDDGTRRVRTEPISLTLRRVIPKVRGKAARRADKRARAALRRSHTHAARVAALEQHLTKEAPQVDW